MKAMIFAAGRGTRLQPLTDTKPKALVKYNGKTLIEHSIENLSANGFTHIVVNVHHFAQQIIDFLEHPKFSHLQFEISDEKEVLLDTGGGLLNAQKFFDNSPFIIYNVDILTNLNLSKLYESHIKNTALATIAVRKRETARYFLFDNEMKMCGWENSKSGEKKLRRDISEYNRLAFSGIHVVSPQIFDFITERGTFSITDAYIRLCAQQTIKGYVHNYGDWVDIGKPQYMHLLE